MTPATKVRDEDYCAARGTAELASPLAASTTDFSGSIRNVQISAPVSNTVAVTRKGAIQNPRWARNPKQFNGFAVRARV